jgi:hypothetical protein
MQTPKMAPPLQIHIWPIDRLVLYARNPRNNDAVVDRMRSIRQFGFKVRFRRATTARLHACGP